jgi:hypothetical protein
MTLGAHREGLLRALRMTSRRRLATGAGAVSEPKSGERRCKPRRAGLAPSRACDSRSPVDRFPRPARHCKRHLATTAARHVGDWWRQDGCLGQRARMSLDEASERVECGLDPAAHGDFPDDDEIPPTRSEVRPREAGAPATSLLFDRGGLGAEHHSVPLSAPTEERAEVPQPGAGVADPERPRNREMESVGGKDIANVLHSKWPPCCSTGVAAPTESEHHRHHRQPPTHAPSMTVQALRPWRVPACGNVTRAGAEDEGRPSAERWAALPTLQMTSSDAL